MSSIRETLLAIQPRSLKNMSHYLQDLLSRYLWAQVLFGFALGIGAGVFFSQYSDSEHRLLVTLSEWVAFPGYLFLRSIQMIVVPLVFTSVIRGVAASENLEQLKSLGFKISLYFLSTTVVSLFLGVLIALTIRPGSYLKLDPNSSGGEAEGITPLPDVKLQDRLLDLIPNNPFATLNEGDMLQIVVFSLVVGIALISMNVKQAQPLLALMESIQEVCMKVVQWAMSLAPLAVFGLTTSMVASVGVESLAGLGVYVLTVIFGLISVLIFYLILISMFAKKNPFSFMQSIFSLQLLAFSTSSSAAVMPLSIKTADEKLGVRESISQFVIPLGATVNMDGTAIYQMIATLFLAQAYGIDLSLGQIVLVAMTSVGASIGSPGAPGVGIVILASILQSVGIPIEGTALLIAVDRILDMLRTVVNVTGDLTASCIMNVWVDS